MYKIDTVIFFPLFKVAQAHADQCVFAHDCSRPGGGFGVAGIAIAHAPTKR